jgi:outer membrane lipoprotein carrier protein
MRHLATALALIVAGAAVAQPAGGGIARLERMLADAKTVEARFEQVLLDGELAVKKETSGRFALARPGKFRWDYAAPDQQTIVSDGKKLWVYDHELAQVTVKPLDGALASSPAALLGGQGELADNFKVTDVGVDGALYWIELEPKVDDAEFEKVRLGLGAKFIEVMELTDAFGQLTRITLRDAKLNAALPKATFQFVPPAGVDVVGDADDAR